MNVEVKNTITTSTKPSNTSPVNPSPSQNDDVNFASELSSLSNKKVENLDKVNEVEKNTQTETQTVQAEPQTTQTDISLKPEQNQVNEKPNNVLKEDAQIQQEPEEITLPLENEINNLLKINTKPVELNKPQEIQVTEEPKEFKVSQEIQVSQEPKELKVPQEPQIVRESKVLKVFQEPEQEFPKNEIENQKPEKNIPELIIDNQPEIVEQPKDEIKQIVKPETKVIPEQEFKPIEKPIQETNEIQETVKNKVEPTEKEVQIVPKPKIENTLNTEQIKLEEPVLKAEAIINKENTESDLETVIKKIEYVEQEKQIFTKPTIENIDKTKEIKVDSLNNDNLNINEQKEATITDSLIKESVQQIIEPTVNTIKVETQPVLNETTTESDEVQPIKAPEPVLNKEIKIQTAVDPEPALNTNIDVQPIPEPVIEQVFQKPVEEKVENKKPSISFKEDEETPPIEEVISGLSEIVKKINTKLTQKDDKTETKIKDIKLFDDNKAKKEDKTLLNNDMNIQDVQTDALAFQMSANMNFNSNGQPFSEFMGNQKEDKLKANASDLAEEKAILSSMDENVAIANRNKAAIENNAKLVEPQVKTVIADDGIKKVDKKTNITVETVVKFDNVIMDKNDVEFFAKLVENQQTEITQETVKSLNVSKTLADLISKSMKDNQPIRIDFDNNISVIIKISKDGKISADFLPSSQVAEAYLKENLPILRQKFDDNNINYDELNHRKHKQDNKDNQKKGRKDE